MDKHRNILHLDVRTSRFVTTLWLVLLMFVMGGVKSWATTIFSLSTSQATDQTITYGATIDPIDASNATVSGGSVAVVSLRSPAENTDKYTYNGNFYFGTNSVGFKVTLNTTLSAGDVIEYTATNQLRFTIAGANSGGVVTTASSTSYTVKSTDEICGQSVIYIWRANGAGTSFNNMSITHVEVDHSNDFEAVVNNQTGTLLTSGEQVQGTVLTFGVANDGTRVASNSPSAVGVISGTYHSEHGMTGMTVTTDVLGPVRITVGACTYSTNAITVTNSANDVVATKNPLINCWKNNRSNVTVLYYNGAPTTLTISGMQFCPYIKVEAIAASEIPSTVNVSFAKGDAVGNAPAAKEVGIGSEYTLPENRSLYKEGYTLTGWSDGTNTYAPGDTYTLGDVDVEFTPVFTANTKSLGDRTASVSLTWTFGENSGAPTVSWQNKSDQPLVTQVTVSGETIDVPLWINTETSGSKFANASRGDKWAQVTSGAVLTAPSCKGATIKMEAYSAISTTTINGGVDYESGTVITSTVTGDGETAAVVIGDGQYYSYIKVTLPALLPEFTSNLASTYRVQTSVDRILSVSADYATSYQWYTATAADKTGETAIAGANSASYTFNRATAGTYYIYCKATNVVGTVASRVATITVSDVLPTFDFTDWSNATVTKLKADEAWNTARDATASVDASHYNTDSNNDSVNDKYIMGGAWTDNVAGGTLMANNAVIPETFGLDFGGPLTNNASAIVYDQQVDYTLPLTFNYQGAKYLQPGANKGFLIPNVRVGSTLRFNIEAHDFSSASGINLFLGGADGTNLTNATTANGWLTTTQSTPSIELTSALVGNNDYVDIYVQPTAVMHIYTIEAEMALGVTTKTKTANVGDTYTLTEGRDYFSGTGGGAISFASMNTEIATVDATGKITAVAPGTVKIAVIRAASGNYAEHADTLAFTVDAPVSVTYDKGDAEGALPPTAMNMSYNKGTVITLPAGPNLYLYKEGYTMQGWTDGTADYDFGAEYTVTSDVTIYPKFAANTKTLATRSGTAEVLLDLQRKNGTPTLAIENKAGILVVQSDVDGETIDVKIAYDTRPGKIANGNWDDWCQVNNGTTFQLPSCAGAVLSFETYNATKTTTIDGEAMSTNESQTPSVNITSTANPITVVMGGDLEYMRWIKILLPAKPKFTVNLSGTYRLIQGRSKTLSIETDQVVNYQWYRNTTASNTGGTVIVGATSHEYGFATDAETEPGSYYFYCVASNAVGEIVSGVATVIVESVTKNHTFDFTNWSETSFEALAADNVNWSEKEKVSGSGNDGVGYYNHVAITNAILAADGHEIGETFPLRFTGGAHTLGMINALPSTDIGTYAGEQYLWMFKGNSMVIPNVKMGTDITLGMESHKTSDLRGFTIYYGNAATDEWTSLGDYKTRTYIDTLVSIPDGAGYCDVKLSCVAHTHLYYIDCTYNDFALLKDDQRISLGDEYTITRGVDYETSSNAALTFAISDPTVATVDASGVITTIKSGSTNLTITQAAHDGMPALAHTMTIRVVAPSDLNALKSEITIHEGDTYTLTRRTDYNTSSDAPVTYTSSDEDVISVSADGLITVNSDGDATIVIRQEANELYNAGVTRIIVHGVLATDYPTVVSNIGTEKTIFTYTSAKLDFVTTGATSYQWYTCDDEFMTNPVKIDGETSSYMFARHTSPDDKYYYCIAENSKGRVVSDVCHITSVRKVQWDFVSTSGVKERAEAGYMSSTSKGRLQCDQALEDQEMKLNSKEYVPVTEGLFITRQGNVLIGDSTNASNNRLQMAKGSIRIPGCLKDEIIVVNAEWATKKKGFIIPDTIGTNVRCSEEGMTKDSLIGQAMDYKFVVTADGSVTLNFMEAALHSITIQSAHATMMQTYDVKAVPKNDESNVLKTYVSGGKGWTDSFVRVPYSYWLKDADGKLYTLRGASDAPLEETFSLESDTTFLIKYNTTDVENVVFLSEAEDIDGAKACTNGNSFIRSSMNKAAYCDVNGGLKVTTLPPGSYRIKAVIFDPAKTPASIHTFTIGEQSVSLAATKTNFTEVESEIVNINQPTDLLWMPTDDQEAGIDILCVYDTQMPTAETPTITVDDENHTFTLTTTEETGKMYYTLDGTVPTRNNGILYEGTPVLLTSNCVIRAITIASEKLPSQVAMRPTDFTTYRLTVLAQPKTYGSVSVSPKSLDGSYIAGSELKLTARAKAGYAFVGWSTTKDGEIISTDHIKTVTVAEAGNTYYAHFDKGVAGYVKFDIFNGRMLDVEGDLVAEFSDVADDLAELEEYVHSCRIFPTDFVQTHAINIPTAYTMFMDLGVSDQYSFALQYWLDKDSLDAGKTVRYELGESRMFKEEGQHVTLVPVFKDNGNYNLLSNRKSGCEIMWDFRTGFGAQSLTLKRSATNVYYSTHADIIGTGSYGQTTIDVPVLFRTADAAVNNDDEPVITNENIDTWMTMVEGTEIIIPSGKGAEFTLATYAPINKVGGTTVNGQAPDNIDDEYIPRTEEGGYIYKWTVDDTDLQDTLRIGNDYSYYQYLTAVLPNAEHQYLSVSSANTGMGTVVVEPETILTENGYEYTNGSVVTVKARRNRFYDLSYWEDEDGCRFYTDGHYEDKTGANLGQYDGRRIDDVVYSDPTDSTITVTLGKSLALKAYFVEKQSYYVDFSAGGEAEGLPPYQQHVEWDEKFVMPSRNQQLYLEGYTLDYYTDADGNRYDFGQKYLVTKNILLTPHFRLNAVSVSDLAEPATVTWPLAVSEGATEIAFSKSAGIIVDQLHIGNDFIDMPCRIDGNKGAAVNTTPEEGCQVTSGCLMTIPVTHGCTIALSSASGNLVNTSIAGTSSQNLGRTTGLYNVGTTASVVYDGTATTETVQFRESRECLWLKVTYPVIGTKPQLSTVTVGGLSLSEEQVAELNANGTLTVTSTPDYEENSVSTVAATATNGGTVTVTQATPSVHTASLILKDAGGTLVASYNIDFNFVGVTAPAITSVKVSGKNATADGSTTVSGAGVNGVVTFTFNHAMSGVVLPSDKHGLAVTEDGGNITGVATSKEVYGSNVYTLRFTYWGLTAGTHIMTIPANTLTDAFGTPYPTDITVKFTVVENSVSVKRNFNFIVTHKQSWDAKTQTAGERVQTVPNDVLANLDALDIKYGTIEEAINAANAATGTDRYYIFVPDGEYQTKGTDNDALTTNYGPGQKYYDTKDGEGFEAYGYYNGRTFLTRDNVSIIGQSRDGTVIFNDPYLYGISYSSTMEVRNKVKDSYFQDLTFDNRYSNFQVERGDPNPTGAAVAVYDRGIHSVWKNVAMKGYQDTYVAGSSTSGSTTQPGTFHTYRYYEDCQIWGTVDFICGSGDSWWERPEIMLRKRVTSNNIVAARNFYTNMSRNYEGDDYMFSEDWGFVFNEGVVKAESSTAYSAQNGKYTIARTWDNSPANTFLKTRYYVMPTATGYSTMNQNLLCRMHEYGSLNADGTPADLTKRTLRAATPAAGSDDCILTAGQAAQYTLHNVLGGDDAFDPTIHTKQISMENALIRNNTSDNGDCIITWNQVEDALCYFIFRIDEATGDTLFFSVSSDASFKPGDAQAGRRFLVRAANERGGLGAPSNILKYELLDTYTVTVKEVGPVSGKGWSTVCLPVDATFTESSDLTVYAAIAAEKTTLKLKKVTPNEGLKAGRGYIIYATAPATYTFKGTHRNAIPVYGGQYSVLEGNPEDHAVSVGTLNIYTLAYKSEISSEVGFYKFVGSQIPAYKAYLSTDYLASQGIHLDAGSKGINFIFDDEDWDEETTDVQGVSEDTDEMKAVYDLSGKPVERSQMRKGQIYIINGEKKLWEGE